VINRRGDGVDQIDGYHTTAQPRVIGEAILQ